MDDDPNSRALRRAPIPPRVARLRKQHRGLLSKVRHKRSAIARLGDEGESVAAELAQRSAALRAEQRGYDAEVHGAFAAILSDAGLSRGARRSARMLWLHLQSEGAVTERAPPPAPSDEPAVEAPRAISMRPIFLRLASVFHPDKVAADDLRARNTELMKDLNRAYRDGDASHLLELARAVDDNDDDGELASTPDPIALETQVAALRTQLRGLSRQMSELRASYRGALALEHRRLTGAGNADPIAAILEHLRETTADTRRLRDLVRRFRDREIDLAELFAGPSTEDDSWQAEVFARAREALAAAAGRRGRRT